MDLMTARPPHGRETSSARAISDLGSTPVLLFNLPEVTLEPNLPFPPLSLQVLRDGVAEVGGVALCFDLAPFGPRIAERLTTAEFAELFRANAERSHLAATGAHELELPPACLAAVQECGLIARVVALAQQHAPLLVGLSIQGTPYASDRFAIGLCKALARALRSDGIAAPVVVGGARTIEKTDVQRELMAEPGIDYLVRGNGLRSLKQLAKGVADECLVPRDVRGLVYREGPAISFARGADPPWGHMAVPIWADRAALPHYRRTVAELAPQAAHVSELAGRLRTEICPLAFQFTVGCVSDCAFCNRASEHGKISPPKEVVDQIEAAVTEFGVREFLFLNSELNFGRTYVHRFCEEIIRRRLDIRWVDSCEFRGLDRDTLEIMRDAGCVALWFGLESVSERILSYIQKRVVPEHAVRILSEADRLGIFSCLNFICGLPSETADDVEITANFLRDHHAVINATMVNIFYLQGGPFADTPERFGLAMRGYQEQVGQTTSQAFDETFAGGLNWEAKKEQMLGSFARIRAVNDQYIPRNSHNMPLVLALHRALGGDKPAIVRALQRMSDPALGNFLGSHHQIVRREGETYLLEPRRQEVLRINEIVARCSELRHLMVWPHVRSRLCAEFSEPAVDAAIAAIRELEAKGYFLNEV
ncbi:MAG: radical SAM protein [Phenylobacterium sp.]|uniref:B12-binding domain-containing radical SAM protein n=1 Tax=Phenylobacterium sp. TaxID=1871053 RepID=UPI00121A1791|nr:radical SAM protein [Phenylobacterium sp.]TAJ69800.1 MAG: radical SAM protein [Phenylobacterium sp.]